MEHTIAIIYIFLCIYVYVNVYARVRMRVYVFLPSRQYIKPLRRRQKAIKG